MSVGVGRLWGAAGGWQEGWLWKGLTWRLQGQIAVTPGDLRTGDRLANLLMCEVRVRAARSLSRKEGQNLAWFLEKKGVAEF